MASKPLLVVFAGPNGSGKSTLAAELRAGDPGFPSLYINADDIAKQNKIGAIEAAVEAARQRAQAVARRRSFATETVLSTQEKIDFLKDAKRAGYEILLLYITTQSQKINVKRIEMRVTMGGHDVPPEKTARRYDRSMNFLAEALKLADVASIFNNSFEHPLLIAEKTREGQLVMYPQEPPSIWSAERLRKLLGIREKNQIMTDQADEPAGYQAGKLTGWQAFGDGANIRKC